MATAIIESGYDTVLWARRQETLDPYRGLATLAPTPALLAEQCDIIGVCVRSDDDVLDVALRGDGILAGARPGSCLLVHSTTHPSTCIELEAQCADAGLQFADAPVSGGGSAAAERRLLVMVGSEEGTFVRVHPVLSSFGNPVVRLGGVGAGQIAKLVNNVLVTANLSLAHDAVRLGGQFGLDPAALTQVLQQGSGRSFALEMYAGMRKGFDEPSQGVRVVADLLSKDVTLGKALVVESKADAGLLLTVAECVLRAIADHSAA